MSIYSKLNQARSEFHSKKLKKSGKNKFAGYQYFELGDFVLPAMESLSNKGLCAFVSFTSELAKISCHEVDGDGSIEITSPFGSAQLKGAHEIQNIGAVETYQRRYLWMALMEIVEHDAIDGSNPDDKKDRPHPNSVEGKAMKAKKRDSSQIAQQFLSVYHSEDQSPSAILEAWMELSEGERYEVWHCLNTEEKNVVRQLTETNRKG